MLKDLVWKETNKEEKIDKLFTKYSNIWTEADTNESRAKFMFDNTEQIAKEKAEILNKPNEYTKQDIIDMFVEAGFQCNKHNTQLTYFPNNSIRLRLIFCSNDLVWFQIDKTLVVGEIQSKIFGIDDRKSIEFYYNKFREILEFETKENK